MAQAEGVYLFNLSLKALAICDKPTVTTTHIRVSLLLVVSKSTLTVPSKALRVKILSKEHQKMPRTKMLNQISNEQQH